MCVCVCERCGEIGHLIEKWEDNYRCAFEARDRRVRISGPNR